VVAVVMLRKPKCFALFVPALVKVFICHPKIIVQDFVMRNQMTGTATIIPFYVAM
jgi:hypothetical protein